MSKVEQSNYFNQGETKASSSPERLSANAERTVAVHLTRNANGEYRYVEGTSAEVFTRNYSLMKYGSLPAVRYMADITARAALHDPNFLQFLADGSDQQLYICSPGIYNVPSSSNLLLKETAARLNIYFSQNKMPTLLAKDVSTVGESILNYSELPLEQRKADKAGTTIMPPEFSDKHVVYLDDVHITGTGISKNTSRIYEVGARNVHVLLAAQMDPTVVKQMGGAIEADLNKQTVDGTVTGGFLDVLKHDFVIVQKTLRLVLDPRNHEDLMVNLPQYFSPEKLNEIYLKLYTAAAGNDYWNRYQGKFVPSLQSIREHLYNNGIIDEAGLPTDITL